MTAAEWLMGISRGPQAIEGAFIRHLGRDIAFIQLRSMPACTASGHGGTRRWRQRVPRSRALEPPLHDRVVFGERRGGNAHRHLLGITEVDDLQFQVRLRLLVHDELLQVEVE